MLWAKLGGRVGHAAAFRGMPRLDLISILLPVSDEERARLQTRRHDHHGLRLQGLDPIHVYAGGRSDGKRRKTCVVVSKATLREESFGQVDKRGEKANSSGVKSRGRLTEKG